VRIRGPALWAIAIALSVSAGCRPATAQGGADACAPPPAWPQPGAKPGGPDTELAACLKDRAYQARGVGVPVASKTAGVIAQCEVEVDRSEGRMAFGGAAGSDEERKVAGQHVQQQAAAAVGAYQGCEDR
jgi:hypothetical protein